VTQVAEDPADLTARAATARRTLLAAVVLPLLPLRLTTTVDLSRMIGVAAGRAVLMGVHLAVAGAAVVVGAAMAVAVVETVVTIAVKARRRNTLLVTMTAVSTPTVLVATDRTRFTGKSRLRSSPLLHLLLSGSHIFATPSLKLLEARRKRLA